MRYSANIEVYTMKKIIVSLTATIALVFTGCFIDSDTATVRINLGNMPVAKVEKKSIFDRIVMLFVKEAVAMAGNPPWDLNVTKVHLGAFDSNNQLLAKKSILISSYPTNHIIEFDVPARNGVTIVVLGEVYYGEGTPIIEYYGKADSDIQEQPLNLTAGTSVNVRIYIYELNYLYVNIHSNEALSRREWDKVIGASSYNIYGQDNEILQSNLNNYFYPVDGIFNYYLEIDFQFSGRKSNTMFFS